MNASTRAIIDKLQRLPPERQAEVEDFVDFLQSRETDRQLVRAAAGASAPALRAVWDNDQDAAYDRI
jgi:ABC-type glycerol-3-phosphate transport system substrate-binding protein